MAEPEPSKNAASKLPPRERRVEISFWIVSLIVVLVAYAVMWTEWLHRLKIGRNPTEVVKVWILLGGASVVVLRYVWLKYIKSRGGAIAEWSRRAIVFAMLVTCFSATVNYARYGTEVFFERVDTYDLIHYYLNVRFFPELGYTDLYPACMVADLDNDGPFFKRSPLTYLAEDAQGYALKPYAEGVLEGEKVKEKFTPARWEAFEHDFLHLQRKMKGLDSDYWAQMVNDHGFNGTPAWLGVATPLARLVPVESVKLLGSLDVILLLAAVGAAFWAYGGWSAAFLYLFLLTSYSTRWPTISWAYLRYDYVASLVIATCLIRKGRHLLAGAFAGHAAAMRVFPIMYLFGPAIVGFYRLVRRRKLDRAALLLLAGFVAWNVLLQGNAIAHWGLDTLLGYWHGMVEHVKPENLSTRREGLSVALAYHGELKAAWGPERIELIKAAKGISRIFGLGLLAILAWGIRRRTSDEERAEGFALGFIPFFALTTASYYYYVVRAPLVLLHAGTLGKIRHSLSLVFFLLVEAFCNYTQQNLGGNRIFLIGWLGWLLLFYALATSFWLVWDDWRHPPLPAASAPSSLPGDPRPVPESA
jgi:hypothetical protein